jgi:hypothetical protein
MQKTEGETTLLYEIQDQTVTESDTIKQASLFNSDNMQEMIKSYESKLDFLKNDEEKKKKNSESSRMRKERNRARKTPLITLVKP